MEKDSITNTFYKNYKGYQASDWNVFLRKCSNINKKDEQLVLSKTGLESLKSEFNIEFTWTLHNKNYYIAFNEKVDLELSTQLVVSNSPMNLKEMINLFSNQLVQAILDQKIWIISIKEASSNFQKRFSALGKAYDDYPSSE